MKTTSQFFTAFISATALLLLLAGCASKKGIYGDSKTGYKLDYRMPKGQPMQYDLVSDFVTNMELMGQAYEVEGKSRNLFTLAPHGLKDGNNKYVVTIDSAYVYLNSARGEMKPDLTQVLGRNFDFEVSPKGKEVDCSGARELTYSLGGYEELDFFADFKSLFPDLPDRPVKPGEPWTNVDTVLEKSSAGFLEFIILNEHQVESAGPFEGYDCLRIKTTFTGTIAGEGELQGARTKTSGTLQGELTWYFAYKEGIFILSETTGEAETTTLASGEGREVTIPSTRKFNNITKLVMN